MLAGLLALNFNIRITLVIFAALAAARFINWAIYNWAYYKRSLGPWSASPAPDGRRGWQDHLPIIGWVILRREAAAHGKRFWVRPLLIELLFPPLVAFYYWFLFSGGTLPAGALPLALQTELHGQFLAQFLLLVLMAIATFIDFDEQSIPDYVTVPGTVIGLLGASLITGWFPLTTAVAPEIVEEIQAWLRAPVPPWLDGYWGLAAALSILFVWGFALLERRWIGRRGLRKGMTYFIARMFRSAPVWKLALTVTALLMIGVSVGWACGMPRWSYLLSSLFGLAFAGGITWGVRLSATWGLGVEALGFGDVTLMAMIGTYIGWQPSLLVFFLAPLVAIVFVLLRWLITGESATPYGPYLCGATVLLLVFWDALWTNWAEPVVAPLGNQILGIVIACVMLMGAILWIWRMIKQALGLSTY